MLRNSRILITRLSLPGAAGLILCCLSFSLLNHTSIADDNPTTDLKEEYRRQQKALVQEARQIQKDLLTAPVKAAWNRDGRNYTRILSTGAKPGTPDFDVLQSGLKYRIYAATSPETRNSTVQLHAALTSLQRDLGGAGRGIQARGNREAFRTVICKEALPLLKELLDNSLETRSFAIEVLPELKTVAAGSGETRNIVYEEVDEALIEILNDQSQPDAVKARAAVSIAAYLSEYDPGSVVEISFAKAIQSELASPVRLDEYQYFLLDALSHIRTGRDPVGVTRKASAIEAAAQVMQDPQRHAFVRCRAAGALGVMGYDQQVDFEPLAWKATQLAVEAADRYQQDPKDPRWEHCGWNLYVAFHHEDANGLDNNQGFLNRASRSQVVRGAYEKTLPLARAMIFDEPIPNDGIAAARIWVQQNVPTNLRYDAQSDPLTP